MMKTWMTLAAAAMTAMATPALAQDESKALIALEQAYSDAFARKDVAFAEKLLAPEWRGIQSSGDVFDKAALLREFADRKVQTSSIKNHDVSVAFYGDIAVVQGFEDEVSTYDGKDSSGAYAWTDVFQKRGGNWTLVRSQTARVN